MPGAVWGDARQGLEHHQLWFASWPCSCITACSQQLSMAARAAGGRNVQSLSNVVFSSGGLDPWQLGQGPAHLRLWPWQPSRHQGRWRARLGARAGSIQHNISDTVLAVNIPEGAHHLDLMFSHPDDPPAVRVARQFEMGQVQRWVEEHHAQLDRAQLQGEAGAAIGLRTSELAS